MKRLWIWMAVMVGLLVLGKLIDFAGASFVGLIVWTFAVTWIAMGFYRVRELNRLIYGVVELAFGTTSVFLVLFSLYKNKSGVADGPLIIRMALMLAAVYVIVRAFDNIGAGLKGKSFERRWRKIMMFE